MTCGPPGPGTESARPRLGAKSLFFDRLDSTNRLAGELARDGEPEGTVVAAGVQTAGRGRGGREWASPEGGCWFSLILRPDIPPREVPKLTLLAGAAVALAVRERFGLEPRLKWPNDVLVGGKKLAGILTESRTGERPEHVVVGFGINADVRAEDLPPELRATAATLRDLLGRRVDGKCLLKAVLAQFEELYIPFCGGDRALVLKTWSELSGTLGRRVVVKTPSGAVEGTAVRLDGEGALVVLTSGGERAVPAGDCLHLD